jgi:hypothetical protein
MRRRILVKGEPVVKRPHGMLQIFIGVLLVFILKNMLKGT